jgi:uncharacterized protein (DUF1499 family)
LIGLMERGMLPDAVIRIGIRLMPRRRLQQEDHGGAEANREHQRQFFADLAAGPVAVATDAANRQHYELPPEFFGEVLGRRRKYSCCLYPIWVRDLATAEEAMLRQTCRRAGLADGMDILELGCGWGSLTLWMTEHYRNSRITAVSNSLPQRVYIETCFAPWHKVRTKLAPRIPRRREARPGERANEPKTPDAFSGDSPARFYLHERAFQTLFDSNRNDIYRSYEIMSLGRTLLPILVLMGMQVFSDSSADGSGDFRSPSDRLAPCPSSPNCVSTQAKGGYHAIQPIPYTGSREGVVEQLKAVLQKMKRSRIITVSPDYLHVEFRTFLGFVDDVEFYIDQVQHLIHMRSASRTGYWDFGVNRRRLETIRVEFNRLESREVSL